MVKIFRVIPPNPKTPILAAIVPVVDGGNCFSTVCVMLPDIAGLLVAGISSGMALMVASELPQS
jgi:hypothetical protein